jgi:hypothetical protein
LWGTHSSYSWGEFYLRRKENCITEGTNLKEAAALDLANLMEEVNRISGTDPQAEWDKAQGVVTRGLLRRETQQGILQGITFDLSYVPSGESNGLGFILQCFLQSSIWGKELNEAGEIDGRKSGRAWEQAISSPFLEPTRPGSRAQGGTNALSVMSH